MDPFWKTIFGTVLGAASMVGASYSANWIANHTYRVHGERPVAQMPVVHWSTPRTTAPNYYQRHTTDYSSRPAYPYRSRH